VPDHEPTNIPRFLAGSDSQLLLIVAALDASGYSRVGKQKEEFSEKALSAPTK